MARFIVRVCLVVLLGSFALAQTTGIPPFSSVAGGPDAINLANFNVHFSFPTFSRAGRGISFSYPLSFDSSIWSVIPGTPNTWGHALTWGTNFGANGVVGTVYFQEVYRPKGCGGNGQTNEDGISFLDPNNTSHHFAIRVDDCSGPRTVTGIATDGSGISMTFTFGGGAVVNLPNGEVLHPLIVRNSSLPTVSAPPYTRTDANGNQITIQNGSGSLGLGTATDTLGTLVLSGSGLRPNPEHYNYTNPSGASISVVITYRIYSIQTAFGCPNFSEYTQSTQSLLDRITYPDGSYYGFTYESTGGGNVSARIASVRLPSGGIISYTYKGGDTNKGIFCADGSTAGFDRATPDGTWQYRRTNANPRTTTLTDPQGKVTVINFVGNYETQRQIYDGPATGTPLETLIHCYNGNNSNPSQCVTITSLAPPFSEVATFRSLSGGPRSETDTFYNGTGSVTDRNEYDFGASTPTRKTHIDYDTTLGNNIVDRPSDVKVTDGTGNLLQSETDYVYDEDQGSLQPSGAPQLFPPTCTTGFTKCRGNVTTIKRHVTATTTLTQTFTHYDTGQVYTATDANGAVTTNTYGACGNSFLTSVLSMPLGLSTSQTWDCNGGVVTSTTDENGQPSGYTYISPITGVADPLWRLSGVTPPLTGTTSFDYPSATDAISSFAFNSGNSWVYTRSAADGLGRPHVMQRLQVPNGTTFDSVETDYDSVGRVSKVTQPYSGGTGAACSGTCPGTTTTYDALNRPLTTTDGGGGTLTYCYGGTSGCPSSVQDVLVTFGPAPGGENLKKRQYEYDGLGRLTSVCEILASGGTSCGQLSAASGYKTLYTYTVLSAGGSQTTVTQGSQTRIYTYDALGRLTSEVNPESGTTTYLYDSDSTCGTSQGDLVKRQDANQNVACYAYDKLHRVTMITYPSGPNASVTPAKYFAYDTPYYGSTGTNIKGRLVAAATCQSPTSCAGNSVVLEEFGYSARGELTDVWQVSPNSGGLYHTTAGYWANGALNTLGGVPGRDPSTFGLDGEGRLKTAVSGTSTNLVTNTTYNEASHPTNVVLGSGDSDVYHYDANTGRMDRYTFTVGSTPQSVVGALQWNPNGTLQQLTITDPFNAADAQICNYGYDDLERLASANCGSAWSQTFTFDQFGNINKSGSLSFHPTYSSSTNQIATLPGTTAPTYDANGNLLTLNTNGSHVFSWDAEGKAVSMSTGAQTVTLTYDALGRMVEQAQSAANTEILYGPTGRLALMNGQTVRTVFLPLPGGDTAVIKSGNTPDHYRHADWLGSARFSSTSSQTMYYDVAYAPFGETYNPSGTADRSFTGRNQDTLPAFYDFLYREYDYTEGRWISPDPSGIEAADPSNPQSWNRYAYVGNAPVNTTDPQGLDCKDGPCNPFGGFGDFGFGGQDMGCFVAGFSLCNALPGILGGGLWSRMSASNTFLPSENSTNWAFPLPSIWDLLGIPPPNLSNCNPICDATADPASQFFQQTQGLGMSRFNKVLDGLKAFGSCTAQHFGLTAVTAGTAALGVPVSKAALGVANGMAGASDSTSVAGAVGFKLFGAAEPRIGIRVMGTTRLFGAAGRLAPLASAAMAVVDAHLIGACMDQKLGY